MTNKRTNHKRIKTFWAGLGFALLVQGFLVIGMMASSSAYWVWSLRVAINDLKFYPDQVFPALTYPVDFDAVAFPVALNDSAIQIPQGAELTWINKDRNPSDEGDDLTIIPHLIQVKDKTQSLVTQSPLLAAWGQTFTTRFDQTGEFTYNCFLHPQMRGKVVVSPWGLELVERR